jgi:hypothetical protein
MANFGLWMLVSWELFLGTPHIKVICSIKNVCEKRVSHILKIKRNDICTLLVYFLYISI